jgi:uncharacterized protein (TIGR02145 family)
MKCLKHLQLWSHVVAVGSLALLAACGGVSDSSKVTEPADVTNGNLTDSRDGKTYKTVTIGSQTWMAENLNYADSANTPSLKGKSWCYNDSVANCEAAGRLYTWAAAIDSVKLANDASNPLDCGFGKTCGLSGKVQGICPSGWHLPSPAEWKTLFAAVGGQDNAGKVLKSQSGWDENGNGTDAYGFSARPVGYREGDGYFYDGGKYAYFWCATEFTSGYANNMYLRYYYGDGYLYDFSKNNAFPVRCLKD